jgi:phosphoribosylglycinamide formyltransferase/phosphoribosylglycinamide formyltransferase-1
VLVASDRQDAGALGRAARAGIATAALPSRETRAAALDELLTAQRVDLIALAGYMQYVPHEITRRFAGRMLNVHPALLPAFGGAGMYGPRVHRAVLAAGATTSGPTVHFVDDVYDHGTVIAQWPVPVRLDDDEHTLAARVLRAEHILYPRVVQAVAAGEVRLGPDGHIEHPFVLDVASLPPLDEELGHPAPNRTSDP